MAVIKLIGFSGEQPRVLPRLMPQMAAQAAVNTRLDDGGLTPIRASALIETLTLPATPKTIFLHGETWLAWDAAVNAAPGPVAQDRLYFTGDGAPKMRVAPDIYDLAIPAPTAALTATPSGVGSGDIVSRLYVYTWVTDFGEESEPCPASAAIEWQPGQTVTLSGFAAPPTGRAVTKQRIYRTQTGTSGTGLYFIAERDASNADYVDTIAVEAFGEPIPSVSYNSPPDDLAGLISLPNGMMAAFSGRKICFCEPFQPHAWPEKYMLSTDSAIVALGAAGTSIIVMTEGQPYIVSGSTPESMVMEKLEQNLPCINARAVVDMGYAIAYPSHEGLVTARADGSFSLATANIFNPDDWRALSPETMIGSQISGRYVAFYDTFDYAGNALAGMLMIDLSGQSFLVRSDAICTAAFYNVGDGGLYYLARDTMDIRRFDAPGAQRLHQFWKSKPYVLPHPDTFGVILIETGEKSLSGREVADAEAENAAIAAANAALVTAGPVGGEFNAAPFNARTFNGDILAPLSSVMPPIVSVTVFADGRPIATKTQTNTVLRLPAGFTARTWEISAFGNGAIEQIVMAKSVDELKGTP